MDIHIADPNYPEWLKEIHRPPPVLHVLGNLLPDDKFAVAIVGSRNATLYGMQVAERFAYELARRGITIVSGMARGIDAAAHRGALKAKGRTIAVLGSGLDRMYPKEHRRLAEEISKHGCVLTEFPDGTEARPYYFPQRNRIISGLSMGTIVAEASRRSGSLITAAHALEQGRYVFAVPGPVDSLLSEGCHSLIKDGAKLIDSVEDVLVDLLPVLRDMPEMSAVPEVALSPDISISDPFEKLLLVSLAAGPLDIGQLGEMLGRSRADIQERLVKLEITGKIHRLFGGRYETVNDSQAADIQSH